MGKRFRYPDITTLTKLAELLGVTTNELLNGRLEEHSVPKDDRIVQNTLQYAEKVTKINKKKCWEDNTDIDYSFF